MSDGSTPQSKRHHESIKLCEIGVGYELEETDGGDFSVNEGGYLCPNDAIGKYEIELHAHGNGEYWLCESHRDGYEESGNLVREVA